MAIYDQNNKNFFNWLPPTQPGSVSATFGIYKEVLHEHPFVFIYYDITKEYDSLILDTHYTITNIKLGLDDTYTFDINYTQQAIDDFPNAGILSVYRNTELSQTSKFAEGDNLPVKTIGDALDKLTMITQDNKSIVDLSIRAPFVDMYDTDLNPTVLKELPIIDDRKDKYLYFNADGQPIAVSNIDVGTIPFSDWGEELVNKQDSVETRTYIDCAKTDGDNTQTFQVATPIGSSDAVPLNYVDNLVIQIGNLGQNNLMENSQFFISQRGFLDVPSEIFDSNKFFFDRWQSIYGSDAIIETGATTDIPDVTKIEYGRPNRSQYFVVTTPATIFPIDDVLCIQHSIEDRALQSVISGSVTFGCWMKIEGFTITDPDRLCIAILNEDETYSYIHEYTLTTNEWEYITFTVDLSTLNISTFDGSAALKVVLTLDCGTDFNGGTNGAWINSKEYCTSNQVSFSTISNAKFSYCNPVLVQANNNLPANGSANLYRSFDDEYSRCKRFFQHLNQNQLIFRTNTKAIYSMTCRPEMASIPIPLPLDPSGTIDIVFFKHEELPNYEANFALDNYTLTPKGGAIDIEFISGSWPDEPVICDSDTNKKVFLTCEI